MNLCEDIVEFECFIKDPTLLKLLRLELQNALQENEFTKKTTRAPILAGEPAALIFGDTSHISDKIVKDHFTLNHKE